MKAITPKQLSSLAELIDGIKSDLDRVEGSLADLETSHTKAEEYLESLGAEIESLEEYREEIEDKLIALHQLSEELQSTPDLVQLQPVDLQQAFTELANDDGLSRSTQIAFQCLRDMLLAGNYDKVRYMWKGLTHEEAAHFRGAYAGTKAADEIDAITSADA